MMNNIINEMVNYFGSIEEVIAYEAVIIPWWILFAATLTKLGIHLGKKLGERITIE